MCDEPSGSDDPALTARRGTDALLALGIDRITIAEVKALDPRARPVAYRGSTYVTWFAPQIKIEVVVGDEQVDDCVETIRSYGRTDDTGQRVILIVPVDDASAVPAGKRRGSGLGAARRGRIASLVLR